MPDVNEGLSEATEKEVNSNAGFSAALAELVGSPLSDEKKDELSGRDTSIESGLTFEADTTKAVEKPAEVETPVEEVEETAVDPGIASVLEKHGGDATAALADALKQIEDAQSHIGKQSTEVAETRELREKLARLEGMVEAQSKTVAPAPERISQSAIEEMVEERGGAAVAQWAAQSRPDAFEDVLRAWLASDVTGEAQQVATRYYTSVAVQQANAEAVAAQVKQEPQSDEFLLELKQTKQTNEAISAVADKLDPAVWEQVKEKLVPLLEDPSVPDLIKRAVASTDKGEQIDGIASLVEIAKGRVVAQQSAQTAETDKVKETKKVVSIVGRGSLKPVDERQPDTELTSEERAKKFHERLIATETTSVREGLSYAKA